MELSELLEIGFKFHGHRCPAMPLGIRAGLLALDTLGVRRAANKELFCLLENGPAHATMCFGDGVQVATGCTYGKGNIKRLDYGKNGLILVECSTRRAVRVVVKPEFQKKALSSQFVKLRSLGYQPQDIPPSVVDPLIERIVSAPAEELFNVSDVFTFEGTFGGGTFEWYECEGCGEVVFAHGIRIKDGRKLCIPCFEGKRL